MRNLLSCVLIGIGVVAAGVIGPVAALLSSEAEVGEPVLVVHVLGAEAEAVVAEHNGRTLGPVSAPFGLLAISDDPVFLEQLRGVPGLMLADGRFIAQLCGVTL